MDMECVFIFTVAIIASILGGHVASSRLDTMLWAGTLEEYGLPAIAAVLSGLGGILAGVVIYNAPLVMLGFLLWGLVIRYTVIRGLRNNRNKYSI